LKIPFFLFVFFKTNKSIKKKKKKEMKKGEKIKRWKRKSKVRVPFIHKFHHHQRFGKLKIMMNDSATPLLFFYLCKSVSLAKTINNPIHQLPNEHKHSPIISTN
jgi:hypothetical protein